jgi:MFS-type transporter involved in bile tolerance (Atg22 family)
MTNTTPLISSMLLLLQYIILLVCFIGSAFFVNSALTELASRSGIKEFASAGKWLLIGAILTIIIFGTIIIGIAFLILITAFSALKETNATPPSPYATETIPSLNTQTKAYYTYCGTPVLPEATFCTQCGKHI